MPHSPLALQTTFADPSQVDVISGDPDAFDSDDCSIYADNSGDTGSVAEMIEQQQQSFCDCGNGVFHRERCTQCGARAPWARKLGIGLA